jgi:hypothetical protein
LTWSGILSGRIKRIVKIIREIFNSFKRAGKKGHRSLKTSFKRGVSNVVFFKEVFDVVNVGFVCFKSGWVESKVHG